MELAFEASAVSEPTDESGKFTLTLPLDDAPFAIRSFGKVGGKSYRSDEITIAPDEGRPESPIQITVGPVATGKRD